MTTNNLPKSQNLGTDQPVRDFFDRYYQGKVEYSANDVDAVLGFFNNRGFDEQASSGIAATLLRQAKLDGVSTFKLLDTLKGLSNLQLSALVTQILNLSRVKSSAIGYKTQPSYDAFEARNILP
jgi:hypothetical protein